MVGTRLSTANVLSAFESYFLTLEVASKNNTRFFMMDTINTKSGERNGLKLLLKHLMLLASWTGCGNHKITLSIYCLSLNLFLVLMHPHAPYGRFSFPSTCFKFHWQKLLIFMVNRWLPQYVQVLQDGLLMIRHAKVYAKITSSFCTHLVYVWMDIVNLKRQEFLLKLLISTIHYYYINTYIWCIWGSTAIKPSLLILVLSYKIGINSLLKGLLKKLQRHSSSLMFGFPLFSTQLSFLWMQKILLNLACLN